MKTRSDGGDDRAVSTTPPGIQKPDSILQRIVRILFCIVVAMLIKRVAQNELVRRWLWRLFPKFHSKSNETTIIDV
jgi:hypothetical protein